jgi:hypothetical protein
VSLGQLTVFIETADSVSVYRRVQNCSVVSIQIALPDIAGSHIPLPDIAGSHTAT